MIPHAIAFLLAAISGGGIAALSGANMALQIGGAVGSLSLLALAAAIVIGGRR